MTDIAPSAQLDLVAGTRSGDSTAFALLYDRHVGALLRSATLLLQNRADAEDLVHDLFVGLPEALAHYEERGAFGAWLARIATRMALTRLRTRKRRGEVELDGAANTSIASHSERLADRLLVEQALARLPKDSRLVVVLRDLHGWSYSDIAEFTGEREGTIMTRHSRAMERLKAALEEIK